jgi:hypothetical protein
MTTVAYGWEDGKDYDLSLDCVGAPMKGADKLVIRIPLSKGADGSFAVPELVGLKNEMELWIQPLPKADQINAAKSNVACKGARGGKGVVFDLASQYPADNGWTMQRFRWDGYRVRKMGQWINR